MKINKKFLGTTQVENKIDYLEKNKINKVFFCYKRKHKEFLKNNKITLKTHKKFKTERHNGFTEEINKIALS